ncbi:MAG TPA: hypothetical protein VE991_13795, partial [Acidimicrobiales bacterium]|nr:hypothetical protein [Acidimicrobiales bacterium]
MNKSAVSGRRSRRWHRSLLLRSAGAASGLLLVLATSELVVPGAGALPPQAGPCANTATTRVGNKGGIVPPRPTPGKGQSCASSSSAPGGAASTTPPASGYSGSPPLINHAGPVLAATGTLTVVPVFWAAPGFSFPNNYQALVTQFVTDAVHDNTLGTDVFSVLNQYTDPSGHHISTSNFALGSAITDTDALPPGACTPDSGTVYTDGTGYKACIDDVQLQNELSAVMAARSLSSGAGDVYLIFLPKAVESCFGTANDA